MSPDQDEFEEQEQKSGFDLRRRPPSSSSKNHRSRPTSSTSNRNKARPPSATPRRPKSGSRPPPPTTASSTNSNSNSRPTSSRPPSGSGGFRASRNSFHLDPKISSATSASATLGEFRTIEKELVGFVDLFPSFSIIPPLPDDLFRLSKKCEIYLKSEILVFESIQNLRERLLDEKLKFKLNHPILDKEQSQQLINQKSSKLLLKYNKDDQLKNMLIRRQTHVNFFKQPSSNYLQQHNHSSNLQDEDEEEEIGNIYNLTQVSSSIENHQPRSLNKLTFKKDFQSFVHQASSSISTFDPQNQNEEEGNPSNNYIVPNPTRYSFAHLTLYFAFNCHLSCLF